MMSSATPLVVCLLIIILVIFLVPGLSASSAESERCLAEGVELYTSGDWGAALQTFESLTSRDPTWPSGWLWKGTVLADMGNEREAEEAFKIGRCLLNPDGCGDSSPYPSQKAYPMPGADRFNPKNSGEGDFNKIQGNTNSSPLSDPMQLEREGDQYMEKGAYDAALRSYLRAQQFDPKNPDLTRKTGDAYRASGDLRNALEAWNHSIQSETDPAVTDILRKKRSDAFSTMNMPDAAIRELEMMKNPASVPHVFYQKGELSLQLQDYARAEESFQESLIGNPGDIDSSLGLAEAQIRQGKIAKAKDTLKSLPQSALNPDQVNILERLKREYTLYDHDETSDISFLFSSPVFYLLIGIGIFGIFYFRDTIFR